MKKFKDPDAEYMYGKAAYRPHPNDKKHAMYCNEPAGRGLSCTCSQAWKDAQK